MMLAIPWVILGLGLALCWFWQDEIPSVLGTREEAYTIIAIVFGVVSFEVDTLVRYGRNYLDEYGDFSVGFAFVVKPLALLMYWLLCRGIMGREE
jgi:uncharacterized membrane protein YjdF